MTTLPLIPRAVIIKLLISVFFLSAIYKPLRAQDSLDYKIYSNIINAEVGKLIMEKQSITSIVIIEKYRAETNEVSDISPSSISVFNGKETLDLLNTVAVKQALSKLSDEFLNMPTIEVTKLNSIRPVVTIDENKFHHIAYQKGDQGWRHFYKTFGRVPGIYALSKVTYSQEYACLYVAHFIRGLNASGDLYILKQTGSNWEIMAKVNLWVA